MKHQHTKSELEAAIRNSSSVRSALEKLGVVPAGGNYQTFHKRIRELNLDISHFTGQAWNKGKHRGPQRPLEAYLSNEATIISHKLKLRLIGEKVFKPRCSNCHRRTWLKKQVPLEIDHIDGNSSDNRLENLRLLCPNCHAQTSTYRGKNIPLRKLRSVLPV